MKRAPMLRVAVALATGIVLSELMPNVTGAWVWWMLGVSALLTTAAYCMHGKCGDWLFVVPLWITLTMAGWQLALLRVPQDPFAVEPGRCTLQVRLEDTPHPTARSMKVRAAVETYHDSTGWHTTRGDIMLFLQPCQATTPLAYGQRLWVRTRPQRPNGEQNPYQFDYRRYLRHKGILWQCYVDSTAWHRCPQADGGWSLIAWSKALQRSMVARLQATSLTPSQKGLAEALLLGWRDDLAEETVTQFRDVGIAHLLCVSGLHVGIVAWLAGWLLLPLGWRPRGRAVRGVFQIAIVWLFVMITGMAPSTLRAGAMFSLLIVGGLVSLRGLGMNNLCTSAVILLLAQPGMLFDVGFQLSYAAVASILLLNPPLQGLIQFPENRKCLWWLPRKIWLLACLSTAAQLGTLPLVLYYFHKFSTWFLIANLTLVPCAGVLLMTVLGVVTLQFWPWACSFLTHILHWELSATDGFTRWVGSLPYAMMDNLYCDLPLALMTAACVLLLTVGLQDRRRWACPAVLTVLIAITLYMRMVDWRAEQQREVMVYAAGRHWAVEYFCGRESYLLADSAVVANPSTISIQRDKLIAHRRIQRTTLLPVDRPFADSHCAVENHVARMGGNTLLVIDRSNARRYNRKRPTAKGAKPKVDIVLVAPGTWVDSSRLAAMVDCDTLVHYPQTGFSLSSGEN